MLFFSKLAARYNKILWYFLASFTTACLDAFFLYTLKALTALPIVTGNTISVVSTTVVHYIWVSKKSFGAKVSVKNLAVYIFTFVLGLSFQNLVIWTSFEILGFMLLISKGISLASSFFLLYFLRKILYAQIKNQ